MNFKLGKDSSITEPQGAPAGKKSQTIKLALLLLLVGGFAYLYFFTGLLKPEEVPITAVAPPPTQQIVRRPLPPRNSGPEKPETKPAAGGGAKAVTVAAAPSPVAVAPVKPTPVAIAPAKPAPVVASPAKPAPIVAAPAKPAPVVATPAPPVKAAPRQPPVTLKGESVKIEPASNILRKKPLTPVVPAKKMVKKHAPAPPTRERSPQATQWSLVAENYVLEEKLADDLGLLRKAGLTPAIKPAPHKIAPMNRLRVAECTTRAESQSALQRLKRITSDAFVIEQGGKFVVYAGSYLQTEAAHVERDRLKLAGVTTTVTRVDIAIPTQNMIIGPFAKSQDADKALETVKKLGIKVIKVQK